MKNLILSVILISLLFEFSFCSNLFFQWRITESEKIQIEKEMQELLRSNIDLYRKIFLNFDTRTKKLDKDPILKLSRYTHCQKCLDFSKRFKNIKEKYGFKALIENLKNLLCSLLTSMFDTDVCEGYLDKYGYIIVESFFTKYFSGYFFCEKIDLCPAEETKNYLTADSYAKRILDDKTEKEKERPEEGGDVIRMLQITDVHIDPKYETGSSTNCLKPICCRKDSTEKITEPTSGKYGFEGKCDVPLILLESFVEDAVKRNIDFIIWTGDNAPHDSWVEMQDKVYSISKTIKDTIDSKFKTEQKNIPIFYTIGNHEKYPNDDYRDNESEMLEKLANVFEDYLDEDAIKSFKAGGYYTKKLENTDLRIIALNCLVCDSFNFNLFNSTKAHTKAMFEWLEDELKKAETNNEFIYILNHFPLNGDFTLTECAKRFQALFDRYEYNIRGIFSGHTHFDDIEGITQYFNRDKIIHMNYISPSFTTYNNRLPSYRIYTIDKKTMRVLDYEQFRFNMTKSNEKGEPYWYSAYNASDFFKVKNMTEYDKILNVENIEEYLINRYAGSQDGINNKNNERRKKEARCTMRTNNYDEYYYCLGLGFEISYNFLYAFSNFFIGPFEDFE